MNKEHRYTWLIKELLLMVYDWQSCYAQLLRDNKNEKNLKLVIERQIRFIKYTEHHNYWCEKLDEEMTQLENTP